MRRYLGSFSNGAVRRLSLLAVAMVLAVGALVSCGGDDEAGVDSADEVEDLSDEEVELVLVDLLDDVVALCDGEPDQDRDRLEDRVRDLLSDRARDQVQDRDLDRLMTSLEAGSEISVLERTFERSRDQATLQLRIEVRNAQGDIEERELMLRFEHSKQNQWRLSELPECPGEPS